MEDVDIYFEIFSNISFISVMLITSLCYFYLAKQFMEKSRWAWAVGAAYFVSATALYYIPYFVISNFLAYALSIGAGFAVMFIADRRNIEQKIFLAVTFFSLRWLCCAMVRCVETGFYDYAYSTVGTNSDWKVGLGIYIISCALELIATSLLMFLAVWLIQKAYMYKKAEMTKKELVLLLVPSMSGLLGYSVYHTFTVAYERDSGKSIFDIAYNWKCFLYYLVSFAAILVLIALFQNITARQNEEKRNQLLMSHMEDMKRNISQVERLYRDIRALKHDMGNHIMVLESLCERNDPAEKYISGLKKSLAEASLKIKSGNPITDVILEEWQKEASEKNIEFSCGFCFDEKLDVFDISVILNNGLANAVEAAEGCESPYVSIISYRNKNVYMVEISNSFKNKIVFNNASGLLETSKDNKDRHGFGLSNIQSVARKYFGDIDISTEDGRFTLTVMLVI